MFRRDFFKMLGAAAASIVCAPLVKLLPAPKPKSPQQYAFPIRCITRYEVEDRWPSRIDVLTGWVKQTDLDMKAVTGLYSGSLDAEKDMRNAALDDLQVVSG